MKEEQKWPRNHHIQSIPARAQQWEKREREMAKNNNKSSERKKIFCCLRVCWRNELKFVLVLSQFLLSSKRWDLITRPRRGIEKWRSFEAFKVFFSKRKEQNENSLNESFDQDEKWSDQDEISSSALLQLCLMFVKWDRSFPKLLLNRFFFSLPIFFAKRANPIRRHHL